ncbi:EAL domain-containing protein [Rossellomorea vietnamensis]|uniref:EAL domain-containing protein n=1 Tax=Rossellomorea vietnamensis TaxID=218284 RepID=A0A5D4NK07_9BACI|nr:EAL domain-containing protein [Rossellomorea vietnamensis]TYS14094.1 EAL domain-containing protein [Rossellomorea vietnamensis]
MFFLPDTEPIYLLHGEYSLLIVVLSVVIACCASFTALSLNQKMQQTSFFPRNFWLVLASIAMGLGIWSMHFVGMSAFSLPVSMQFDIPMTILSVMPAVFASYLAFYFANRRNTTHWSYLAAGIIMGCGIAAMHYVGMAAMKMEAQYVYRPWIFLASIVIAVVVSYVALYIFSTLQKYMAKLLIKVMTSILMGLAITSMHYTGMWAVVFYSTVPVEENVHHVHMDMSMLILSVTIGISVLMILTGLTSLLDRYVDYRLNYYDSLTLFPNQRQFEKDHALHGSVAGLAILHIHNLEKWTNGKGYDFGDKIIEAIKEEILFILPADSKRYRIEGNRFAIFPPEMYSYEAMKKSMEHLLAILKKPVLVDNHHILIEMVCAISSSDDTKKVKEMLSNNMAVLQHPSIRYKHELIEYDPHIHTYSFESQLVQDIDRAILNEELFLVYQPKVSSETWTVSGLEALLRWKHPKLGMISPGKFVPILEAEGKIFDVTDWVIENVCKQLSVWVEEGDFAQQVSINIPGPYVTSSRLLSVLKENISKYGIESSLLELEVTETSVIHDIENAIIAVIKFREMGLSVALDDFGTGLSSLSYLRQIPINTIKIDKSFVDGVPVSTRDSSVLRAIITLCYSLNLKVVIEGIETEDQVDYITSIAENPHIQGYYFSKPRTAEEIMAWMKERVSAPARAK